jgi:hypothetical protein
MGLMLGVGMLVDNAVVVLESIDRRSAGDRRPSPGRARGRRPGGDGGDRLDRHHAHRLPPADRRLSTELTVWLKEVGLTISLALVCSLFSSLTLIPLVSAHFLHGEARPGRPGGRLARAALRRVLAWTLRPPGGTFGLLVPGWWSASCRSPPGWSSRRCSPGWSTSAGPPTSSRTSPTSRRQRAGGQPGGGGPLRPTPTTLQRGRCTATSPRTRPPPPSPSPAPT